MFYYLTVLVYTKKIIQLSVGGWRWVFTVPLIKLVDMNLRTIIPDDKHGFRDI